MSKKNETFGRLLKGAISSIATYEGKTAPVIEDELGQQIGIAGVSIQRYKSGKIPPDPRTVQILAEAAIRRGFLGREWLQRFLHAALYPGASDLVEQLCPAPSERPRPKRVYHNLPAPTYSQFVMREQPFAEIIDGLRQRSAAVLIVGMGGNGKTSLAREVVAHCLEDSHNAPHFDAAVWVSDKGREGSTNLSIILDEIARTLDYPGFTQFSHDEKQYEVEQLLRRQKVLLVVDNFETITDGALLAWLLRLPEPSKAIITTRDYRRELRSSWPIELRGMTESEAQELIDERLRALKINHLVNDQKSFEPLIAVTGSNPKAITMTLGLLKHERRPIQQVVDDLYAARGDLFDDLFTRAWALLDDAARRVLLVMPFFVDSASEEALAAAADVKGFAFNRAVERLIDLSLLDVQQVDLALPSRYVLHPLIQAFAKAKIAEQPDVEAAARGRWVEWYVALASKVGFCWDDLTKLTLLDCEQETLYEAINWSFEHQHNTATVRMCKGSGYYYGFRGFWGKKLDIELKSSEAARKSKNVVEEARSLSNYISTLSQQGNISNLEPHFTRLHTLIQDSPDILEHVFFDYHYAIGWYLIAVGDIKASLETWNKISLSKQNTERESIISRIWIAECLYLNKKIEEAKIILLDLEREVIQCGYERGDVSVKSKLAAISLDQGNLEVAFNLLTECMTKIERYQDRAHLAKTNYLFARYYYLRGDIPAARTALTEAIDLFERMGRRRELAEAREELSKLDELETSSR